MFLPGQEDIENLQVLLEEHLPSVIGRMDESAVLSKQKHLQKRLAVVQEDIRNDKNRTSGSGGVVVRLCETLYNKNRATYHHLYHMSYARRARIHPDGFVLTSWKHHSARRPSH